MQAQMQANKSLTRPQRARKCSASSFGRRTTIVCRAAQAQQQSVAQRMATAAAAALLSTAALGAPAALASEFDILGEPTPTTNYYIDDADVLSKSTRGAINKKLRNLEIQSGIRLEVVTVRKLEFETDAFAFAEKALSEWYPDESAGASKGVLLVVTASKEGAVTGGPKFQEVVGEDLVDSIIADNIPIFTEEEKYNQTVTSCVERLEAKILGQPVPDAPKRDDTTRQRTYKTKEETDNKKPVYTAVVGTLLVIAVVVPMLQYYGYTARD